MPNGLKPRQNVCEVRRHSHLAVASWGAAFAVFGGIRRRGSVDAQVRELVARLYVTLGKECHVEHPLVPVGAEPRLLLHVGVGGPTREGGKGGDVAHLHAGSKQNAEGGAEESKPR